MTDLNKQFGVGEQRVDTTIANTTQREMTLRQNADNYAAEANRYLRQRYVIRTIIHRLKTNGKGDMAAYMEAIKQIEEIVK